MASNRKDDHVLEPSTYNCLQCSSKFKQRFNLTKHIKSVHTQDEFQCDQCASSFGRMDNLEKHKRRKQLRSVMNVISQAIRMLNW